MSQVDVDLPSDPEARLHDLQWEVDRYSELLEQFAGEHKITDLLTGRPVDHVAIKAADRADYEQLRDAWLPLLQSSQEAQVDDRSLASGELATVITFPGSLELQPAIWLEIMQPRPAKAGKDIVGFEHIEVLYDSTTELARVAAELEQRAVPYERERNLGHGEWLTLKLKTGQELKLTASRLADVVQQELAAGTAAKLK